MNKSFDSIYKSLKKNFYNYSKINIAEGTILDFLFLSITEVFKKIYEEINNNRTPHIYSSLKGTELDSFGLQLGVIREPNEQDDSFLKRIMTWKLSNEKSNLTAINNSLMNLQYASYVTYVPLTQGTATATAYVIPKSYNEDIPQKAINEVRYKLKQTVSPSTYITYIIPSIRPIKLIIYIDGKNIDLNLTKLNLKTKIEDYINNIAPGDYLSIGEINKIGVNEEGINYFKIEQIYINNQEIKDLEVLQKTDSKFIFEDITWWSESL